MIKNNLKLKYNSFLKYNEGIIFSIISRCYEELIRDLPEMKKSWYIEWKQYNKDVFTFPDSVGACGFITSLNNEIIGMGSWDPRKSPEYAIVGHNCILPKFRGKIYGKQQIVRILNIFRDLNIKKAIVTTGEHQFFLPAQQNYLSCGFKEKRRFFEDNNPYFKSIEYIKEL